MVTSDTALTSVVASRPAVSPAVGKRALTSSHTPTALDWIPNDPASLVLGRYKSCLATTDAERNAACRLRFNVFNAELGEGLIESYVIGLDQDKFDQVCDHLIVEDTEHNAIVGTYRLQSGNVASTNFGYYFQQEFDTTPYECIRSQTLELGRACVHRQRRTSEVLILLWRAIVRYSSLRGLRYLIGCSSLISRNPREGWALYRQLKSFLSAPEFPTTVMPAYRLLPEGTDATVQVKVPKLFKTYIGTGARICSEPAWDRDFGTIDFLTLLDLEQLSPVAKTAS